MNRHDRTLVPLDAAAVHGTDVGLFAQALIHFDRLSLIAPSAESLVPLLDWFVAPGEIETFLLYLRDGVVEFVDTSHGADGDYRARVLEHPAIATLMKGQHRHARLRSFTSGRVRRVDLPTPDDTRSSATAALKAACLMSADLCVSPSHATEIHAELVRLAGEGCVDSFEATVRFPAVRRRVNDGRMDLREVIDLRRRSRPLRAWLQAADLGSMHEYAALHDAVGRESPAAEPWRLSLSGVLQRSRATTGRAFHDAWQPVVVGAE